MQKLKKNKILIVGGTGFVGEYLVRFLSQTKKSEIQVVYSPPLQTKEELRGVKYYPIDLTKNFSNPALNPVSLDSVVIMTQPNNLIIRNILKILDRSSQLKRIIFTSTILVYPNSDKKSVETVRPQPFSVYEKNKIAEEKLLTNYAKKRKIKLSIIRLANVYGNIKNRGIIGLAFNCILKHQALTVNGDGNQKRDYIFVEDAARLIGEVILAKQTNPLELFNICTGKSYSLRRIIQLIEKITNKKLSICYSAPIQEKRLIVGNNTKLAKLFKVKPLYDLPEGLKKTYLNYLK